MDSENIKNEDEKYLDEQLSAYAKSDYYPFHMPGHKRNITDFKNPYKIDITEIEGFDNLHHAQGILLHAQERLSNLYQSKKAYYLVNGSTCGLLSAIGALTNYGDKVLIARNCHKSVYNAVKIFGLRTSYVYPKLLDGGIQGQIIPDDVENVLKREKQITAIIITSPTYEGIVSDIRKIADIAYKYQAYLIIDEAHGAHFSLSSFFPESAVKCGADLVIQSLHKTLPCLTQSAVLHIASERVDCNRVEEMLGIFQTSSPSYVLMAGMDRCVRLLQHSGKQLFYEFKCKLDHFFENTQNLRYLQVLNKNNFEKYGVFDFDQSKIVISTLRANLEGNLNGTLLYRKLLNQYNLQLEMYSSDYVLAMTSIMDAQEGFDRLLQALVEIDDELEFKLSHESVEENVHKKNDKFERENKISDMDSFVKKAYAKRKKAMEISDVKKMDILNNQEETLLRDCIGKVCAEYIFLYPPGIPMIVPGEYITQDFIDVLEECKKNGLNVQGIKDHTCNKIMTVRHFRENIK